MPVSSRIRSMQETWIRTSLGVRRPAMQRWKCSLEAMMRHGRTPSRTTRGMPEASPRVDVGEQHLEHRHPLLDATIDDVPVVGGDDPGHQVEREGPLLTGVVEGHARVDVVARQGVHAVVQVFGGHAPEGLVHPRIRGPRLVGGSEHLVPRRLPGRVLVEQRRHV